MDRARKRLVVERPQVFDRAAAAAQDEHVAFPALCRCGDGGGQLLRRTFALDLCRIDDYRNRRIAPRERGQYIAQCCRLRRSDDADALRVGGQRLLPRGVEQALAVQFVAQLQKCLEQRALARAAH